MDEWQNNQTIWKVVAGDFGEGVETFTVGAKDGRNVTRIEGTTKSGMYANIPYVRVWAGNSIVAEFCQHNVVAVLFDEKNGETE